MKIIQVKRVYDQVCEADGTRILVERLWPRGIAKAKLPHDCWLKEVAPSEGLRRWFGHEPAKWPEFRRRYHSELRQHPDAVQVLRAALKDGPVTLLYSAHDTEHNNAVALREYLLAEEPTPSAGECRQEDTAAVGCC